MNDLIPISDEQAKAIGESAKTVGKAIDALSGVGAFAKETFGTMPQDMVGYLGGDYLKVRRAENLAKTIAKAKERLQKEGIQHPDAPPSLAIPIMIAAADESRDELQDIWAALMAAASNPKKSKAFRLKFIEIVRSMDPLDAAVLKVMAQTHAEGGANFTNVQQCVGEIRCSVDEARVSGANLESLSLVVRTTGESRDDWMRPTPLGRELLRAIE